MGNDAAQGHSWWRLVWPPRGCREGSKRQKIFHRRYLGASGARLDGPEDQLTDGSSVEPLIPVRLSVGAGWRSVSTTASFFLQGPSLRWSLVKICGLRSQRCLDPVLERRMQ